MPDMRCQSVRRRRGVLWLSVPIRAKLGRPPRAGCAGRIGKPAGACSYCVRDRLRRAPVFGSAGVVVPFDIRAVFVATRVATGRGFARDVGSRVRAACDMPHVCGSGGGSAERKRERAVNRRRRARRAVGHARLDGDVRAAGGRRRRTRSPGPHRRYRVRRKSGRKRNHGGAAWYSSCGMQCRRVAAPPFVERRPECASAPARFVVDRSDVRGTHAREHQSDGLVVSKSVIGGA